MKSAVMTSCQRADQSASKSETIEGQPSFNGHQRWPTWAWRKRRKMCAQAALAKGDCNPSDLDLNYYLHHNQYPKDLNLHSLVNAKSSAIVEPDEASPSSKPINLAQPANFNDSFHRQQQSSYSRKSTEAANREQRRAMTTGESEETSCLIEMISRWSPIGQLRAAAATNWHMQNDLWPHRKQRCKGVTRRSTRAANNEQNKPLFTSLVCHSLIIIYLALTVPGCATQLAQPSAAELHPAHLLAGPYEGEVAQAQVASLGQPESVEPGEHDLLVQLIQSTGSLQEANQLLERLILGNSAELSDNFANTPTGDYNQVKPNLGQSLQSVPEANRSAQPVDATTEAPAPIRVFLPGQLADQTELTLVKPNTDDQAKREQHKLLDEIIEASGRDQASQANVNVHYDDDLHPPPARAAAGDPQAPPSVDQDRSLKLLRASKQIENILLAQAPHAPPATLQSSATTPLPSADLHQAGPSGRAEDNDGLSNNESISSLIIRAAQPSRQLIANYSHWINHETGQEHFQPQAARLPVTLLPYMSPPAAQEPLVQPNEDPASRVSRVQSQGIKFIEAPSLTTTTSTMVSTSAVAVPAPAANREPLSENGPLLSPARGQVNDNDASNRAAISNSTSASASTSGQVDARPDHKRPSQLDEFLPVSSHHEPRRVWRTAPAKLDELAPKERSLNSSRPVHKIILIDSQRPKDLQDLDNGNRSATSRPKPAASTAQPPEVSSLLSPEASAADAVSVVTMAAAQSASSTTKRPGSKKSAKVKLKKSSARKKTKSGDASSPSNSTRAAAEQQSVNMTLGEQAAAARLAKSMNLAHLFLGTSRVSDRMPVASTNRITSASWSPTAQVQTLTTSAKLFTELPPIFETANPITGDIVAPTPDSLLHSDPVGKDGKQHWRAVELPLHSHTTSPLLHASKTVGLRPLASSTNSNNKARSKSPAQSGVILRPPAPRLPVSEATRQLLANRTESGWDLDRLVSSSEQPAWKPSAIRRSTVTTSTSTSASLVHLDGVPTTEEPTDYSHPQLAGTPTSPLAIRFDEQQVVGSTASEISATTQQNFKPTTLGPVGAGSKLKYDPDPTNSIQAPKLDRAKVSSTIGESGGEEQRVGARPTGQVINQWPDDAHLSLTKQNSFSAHGQQQLNEHNRSSANGVGSANITSSYYGQRRLVDQSGRPVSSMPNHLDIGDESALGAPTRELKGSQRSSSPPPESTIKQTTSGLGGRAVASPSAQPARRPPAGWTTQIQSGSRSNSRTRLQQQQIKPYYSPGLVEPVPSSTPKLVADESWLTTTIWPLTKLPVSSYPTGSPLVLDEAADLASFVRSTTTERPIIPELIYKDPETTSPIRRASIMSSTTPRPAANTPAFMSNVGQATTEQSKLDWQMSTLPLVGSDPLPSILFHNRLSSLFQYKLANRTSIQLSSSVPESSTTTPTLAVYPFDYQTKEPANGSRRLELIFTTTSSPASRWPPSTTATPSPSSTSSTLASRGTNATSNATTNRSLLRQLQVNAAKQRMKANSGQPGVSSNTPAEQGEDSARKRRASLLSLAAHYAAAYKVRASQARPGESGDTQQVSATSTQPGAGQQSASNMSPVANNTSPDPPVSRFRRRDKHRATLIKNQSDNNGTQIETSGAQVTEQTASELDSLSSVALNKARKLEKAEAIGSASSHRLPDEDAAGAPGNKSTDLGNNELSKRPNLHLYRSLSSSGKRRFSRPTVPATAPVKVEASSDVQLSSVAPPTVAGDTGEEEDKAVIDDRYASNNSTDAPPPQKAAESKLAPSSGSDRTARKPGASADKDTSSDLPAVIGQAQAEDVGRLPDSELRQPDQEERAGGRRERRPSAPAEPRKRRREPPGLEPGPAELSSSLPALAGAKLAAEPELPASMMNNLFARLPQANSTELVAKSLTDLKERREPQSGSSGDLQLAQETSSPAPELPPKASQQPTSAGSNPFLLNDYRTKSLVRTMINLGVPNANSSGPSGGLGDHLRLPDARIRMVRLERPNGLLANLVPVARLPSPQGDQLRLRQLGLKPTLFPRLRYLTTLEQARPTEPTRTMDEPTTVRRFAEPTTIRPTIESSPAAALEVSTPTQQREQISLSTSTGSTTPLSRLVLGGDEPNAETSNTVYYQQQAAGSTSTLVPIQVSELPNWIAAESATTVQPPIWSFSPSTFGLLPVGLLSGSIYTSQPASGVTVSSTSTSTTGAPTLPLEPSSYKPPLFQDAPVFGYPLAKSGGANQRTQRQQPSPTSEPTAGGEQAVLNRQPASSPTPIQSGGGSGSPSTESSAPYQLNAFQRAAVFTVAICCALVVLSLLIVAIAIKCRRSLKPQPSQQNLTSPKADLGRHRTQQLQQPVQRRKRATEPGSAEKRRSSQPAAAYLAAGAQFRAGRSPASKFAPLLAGAAKTNLLLAADDQLGSSPASSPADSTATSMCLSSSSEALNYLNASHLREKASHQQHLLKGQKRPVGQQLVSALARPSRSSKPPKGRPVDFAAYTQHQQTSYTSTMREIGGTITSRLLRMHLPRLMPYFAFDQASAQNGVAATAADYASQLNPVEHSKRQQQQHFNQMAPKKEARRPSAPVGNNSPKLSMSDLLNLASRRTKKTPAPLIQPGAANFQLRSSATDKLVPNYSSPSLLAAAAGHQARPQRRHQAPCQCASCAPTRCDQSAPMNPVARAKLPFGTASSVLRQAELGEPPASRRQTGERLSYLVAANERGQADSVSIQHSQMDNEHHLLIDNQPGPTKLPLKSARLMAAELGGYEQQNYSSHHQLPRPQQRPTSIIYDENEENEPAYPVGAASTALSRPLPASGSTSSKPAKQTRPANSTSVLGTHFSKRLDSSSIEPHTGSSRNQLADPRRLGNADYDDNDDDHDEDDMSSLSDNYYNLEHNYDGHPTYQVSREQGGSDFERARADMAPTRTGRALYNQPASAATGGATTVKHEQEEENANKKRLTSSNCHCNLVLYPL